MKRLMVAGLLSCLALTGCGLGNGLYNTPLPGGADLGDHPFEVKIQFKDALDLVPQSGVRVDDVAVGRVTRIGLQKTGPDAGKVANVWIEVRGDVHLPANATASINQTTLLGEKYVDLAAPSGQPVGQLGNHDTISASRTTNGVEVEVVLGALSEVLNGGGIGQLNEITKELTTVFGNTGSVRTFLTSTQRVVGQLNTNRQSIVQALDSLNTLAVSLKQDNGKITNVLKSFAPGIAILADQRDALIGTLNQLNKLSTVTVDTLDQSKSEIVGDLKALAPILKQLAAAGSALPKSLQILLTYPFPDSAMKGLVGDYLNAYVKTAFRTPCTKTNSCVTVSAANFPAVRTPTANGRSAPPTIAPPVGLLPATTSVAPGLPSTLSVSGSPSGAPGSSSGSQGGH